MDDYFRKSKRRPSVTHRPFPSRQVPVRPPPRAPVATPTPTTSSQGQRAARAPRKRFRKKVTGLFGDQTDLQKRMQKLIRDLPADILTRKPAKSHVTDTSPAHPARPFGLKESIVNKVTVQSVVDKIDAVKTGSISTRNGSEVLPGEAAKENGAMATGDRDDSAMGNVPSRTTGKWRRFQNRMGRLSPRSNDMFLDELNVGTPSPESVRPVSRLHVDGKELEPPKLPILEDLPHETRRSTLSRTQSLDRTGTPAMLRRKVRRNERGYRGADVLRMRLSQAGETPTDRDDGVTSTTNVPLGVNGLDAYLRNAPKESMIRPMGGPAEVSPRRRTRSEMVELPKRESAPKRRRSDVDDYPSSHKPREQDPIALLIEAAEKDSSQVQQSQANQVEEGSDLPPRKSKRLRGSGVRDEGPERWDRRRHTALGTVSQPEKMQNTPVGTPSASTPASRGNGPAQGLRFRSRGTETGGRTRAETGTIGRRRSRTDAFQGEESDIAGDRSQSRRKGRR